MAVTKDLSDISQTYKSFQVDRNLDLLHRHFDSGPQGGILAGKVARILPGRLKLSGEVLRNILHWKQILGKKLHVTGRNFLSQEEISCHRKKFCATGRNLLSQG